MCSGYDNLQSLCKLTTQQLIDEIENYATDCLDASDLGFSEDEAKYYFSNRTMKFNILPGHKHILIAAAEMAIKLLQHSDNVEDEFEKVPVENDHSIIDDEKSTQHNGLHFLSEFSTLGNRGKTISTPPNSHSEPIVFLATSKSHRKSNYNVSSLSTPPLSSDSSPNEQDPLN